MTESPGTIIQLSGFPVGYFVIKNAASHCVFDVSGDQAADGGEVILFEEKEKTVVESFRNPENNNQVFFIDCSGALCSRSSGHAIDVEDDRIVIRHRRPISFPFPNQHAHPLPKFTYSTETGEIFVNFTHDPTYPPPEQLSPNDWENKTYVLTCGIQMRKVGGEPAPRRGSLLGKLVKSIKPQRRSTNMLDSPQRVVHDGDDARDLEGGMGRQERQETWVEVPRSYTDKIRMITVDTANKATEDSKLTDDAKLRRRWLVIPLKD